MDNKKLIGKRIKEIRKAKNYTQERLAELIEIETGSLSAIESGRHYPSLPTLIKIVEVLEVEVKSVFDFKQHLSDSEKKDFIKNNIEKLSDENLNFVFQFVECFNL